MKCELCSRSAKARLCDVCAEMIGRLLQIQERISGEQPSQAQRVSRGASAAGAGH